MVRGGYNTVLANAALQVQFLFGLDRQDHAFIRANAPARQFGGDLACCCFDHFALPRGPESVMTLCACRFRAAGGAV
jgi:hypothetical protein